jgi:hypothetical protein
MLAFILAMVKRVPTVWFRVDERIKSVLLTECGWDNAKADIVNKAIQGDPPKAYDHHTHFHMQMNKEKM